MFLAIEIGGTKLQLAAGQGGGAPLAELRRMEVVAVEGAAGILRQIEAAAPELIAKHRPQAIGIGFGGPVQSHLSKTEPNQCRVGQGRVVKSHHVAGWDDFPLADWCRERFGLPTVIGNDCDVAALAEASFGAGQGSDPVFYVTVGTGIGGGLIVGGRIYQGHGNAAAEIGHLRYGLEASHPEQNIESLAAGWGIADGVVRALRERDADAEQRNVRQRDPEQRGRESISCGQRGAAEQRQLAARNRLPTPSRGDADDLVRRCGGQLERLTARLVADAARDGNSLAKAALDQATTALGWAIAQVITLVSPQVVVIGGGVSQIGEELFLAPLREAVAQYVFPPLAGSYQIVPARLGEEVVLHGALALAAAP